AGTFKARSDLGPVARRSRFPKTLRGKAEIDLAALPSGFTTGFDSLTARSLGLLAFPSMSPLPPTAPFSTPLRSVRNDKLLLQIREQSWLRFLIGEGFGALLAFFHDEFVQRRIDGQGIIAGETGQTEAVQRFSRRAHHAFHIEVAEAIHTKIFADVFHRHLICDQFFRI